MDFRFAPISNMHLQPPGSAHTARDRRKSLSADARQKLFANSELLQKNTHLLFFSIDDDGIN